MPRPEETCFFICPLGEKGSPTRKRAEQVFQYIVKPAVDRNGLQAQRADLIPELGVITTQVIQHVLYDAMVVADLTDGNSNVFYELALRHAFRKPVVQIIAEEQLIPFDVQALRTVRYDLSLDGAAAAANEVAAQIQEGLRSKNAETPLSVAAKLEDLTRSGDSQTQSIVETVVRQVQNVEATVAGLLQQYAREIDLLQMAKQAGVVGLYKRREAALHAFGRAVDEETRDIMVVGSSLKGLLLREEYRDLRDKLRFKQDVGATRVRYMLTHPAVADLRARQENRRPTEIGLEVIEALTILRDWKTNPHDVRLYIGVPTCFAIKTTHMMLLNPYPLLAVAYDAPCLLAEASHGGTLDRSSYFFDDFNARHFGAWDTDLALEIHDFDATIAELRANLPAYARVAEDVVALARTAKKPLK